MRRVDYLAVVGILLVAFSLRILGTATFGYLPPERLPSIAPDAKVHIQTPLQPDEYLLVAIPYEMILKDRKNPQFFEYPSGIIYFNYVLYQLTGVLDDITAASLEGADLRTIAPFELYFSGRVFAVLMGTIAVACAFGVLKLVAGKYAAWMGALLVAVSPLLVQHAHYIKPGIPSSGFMMLALWSSTVALSSQRKTINFKFLLLSGIFTGIAATVRYNAASISIVLFLTGLLIFWRERTLRTMGYVLLSWFLAPMVFLLGTPYILFDFGNFYQQFNHIIGQFLKSGASISPELITSSTSGFLTLSRFLIEFGTGVPAVLFLLVVLLCVIAGRSYGSKRHPNLRVFVGIQIVFIAAYMVVTMRTVRPIFSDNLLLLIIPQILLLVGIGAGQAFEHVRLPKVVLGVGIAVVLLVMPLIYSVSTVSLFKKEDARSQMQGWIYEHIPEGSRFLLIEPYNVPLDTTVYPYDQLFSLFQFRADMLSDYDYIVFSDARLNLFENATGIITDEELAPLQHQAGLIRASSSLVHTVERPRDYPGSSDAMNMLNYWHHPALSLYCLNETACAAASP